MKQFPKLSLGLNESVAFPHLQSVTENGVRVYATPEGRVYPSITTVLGYSKKQYIHEWRARVGFAEADRITRTAASRGTGLHTVVEHYIQGSPDYLNPGKVMPHVAALFRSIQPYIDENLDGYYLQETPVYSDHLGVAGRLDLACSFRGRNTILDIKTARRKKTLDDIETYLAQTCAYSIMLEERTGVSFPRNVIVMAIDDEPTGQLFICSRNSYVEKLKHYIKQYKEATQS